MLASALAADVLSVPALVDFLVGVVFLVVVVFLVAVVFFSAGFAALDFAAPDVFDVALPAVEVAILGSFRAPDTTAFSSDPARNLGTAVFFARLRSPVRGLRTIRDGRTAFSKAPKPVIATFSPFATSRVIVSITDSRACCADFLLPSKRLDSASMSWLLFKDFPFVDARSRALPDGCSKRYADPHAMSGNTPNSARVSVTWQGFPRPRGTRRRRPMDQRGSVTGAKDGRFASYVDMSASWARVMAM